MGDSLFFSGVFFEESYGLAVPQVEYILFLFLLEVFWVVVDVGDH